MQTIYSVLGVFLVSVFALNHKSARIAADRMMMKSEIEMRASGLAREIFDDLAELPFDANSSVSTPIELTSKNSFGDGAGTYEEASDLDDVHGKSLERSLATDSDTLSFAIGASVEYVSKQSDRYVAGTSQTYYKRVTLTIQGPLDTSFTLERVFSYQSF